jgi:hypothetical protein
MRLLWPLIWALLVQLHKLCSLLKVAIHSLLELIAHIKTYTWALPLEWASTNVNQA